MDKRKNETDAQYRERRAAYDRERRAFKLARYSTKDGEVKYETFVRPGRPDAEAVHIPDPAYVSKTSTLYDRDGDVAQQWVLQKPLDKSREINFPASLRAAIEGIEPRPLIEGNAFHLDNLMTVYPIGDQHVGMLAWKYEVGTSNDIDISEKLLDEAVTRLVSMSPASRSAMLVVLGDYLHYDSFVPATPNHGNILDADGRAPKMVRAGIRMLMRAIETGLAKHDELHVVIELGNHDPFASIWMMELLRQVYANNPRVTIDTSPSHYHYHRFGKNLIGVTHGDLTKPGALPEIMAADRREDWGQTEFHMWLTGHIHQQTFYEYRSCTVESFRILPPPDAWAHMKGYRPYRSMKCLILHEDHGPVGHYEVNPSMWEN